MADEEDGIANGTISVSVPNLDALNDVEGKAQEIASTVEKIGGLTWQIKARKVLKPDRLNLFIYCNEALKDNLWLCKVRFKVKAWANGEEEKPFHSQSYGQRHGFNNYYWIFPICIFNIEKLKQKPIEIKLEIKLCKVQEKSLPLLDTNLVVNMGESLSETLLISKHAMVTLSSYFRNLFFEDWNDKKEQGGKHFELYEPDNFDIRAFKAMIYSAMTLGSCCWMLLESNFLDYELAVEIVKQSIKYDFPMLLDCCEQFLTDHAKNGYQAMGLLELADHFNLAKLTEHCLEKIRVTHFVMFWSGMGMEEMNKKREILLSQLSKVTRERLLTKLDGEKDIEGYLRMKVLELADHSNLNKLKQHCLDEMNILDYTRSSSESHESVSRLSKATREELHAIRNKTKRVLVERKYINKLAKAVLGTEESEESSESDLE